ncbi:MAG: hypothetical protein KDI50_13575, partial [Candidatus Competibacteraceae bacterium]|nr:hypothetical protein [Candidatus Competibacteraceae bacterium]
LTPFVIGLNRTHYVLACGFTDLAGAHAPCQSLKIRTPATVCVDRWNKPSRAGNHAPPPPDNFAVTPRFCRLLLVRRRARRADERARVVPTTGRLRRPVLALPLPCFVQVSPLFLNRRRLRICVG